MTTALDENHVDHDTRSNVEALFREARRRRRRRWTVGCCVVVLGAALGLSAGLSMTAQHGTGRITAPRTAPLAGAFSGAAAPGGATNLDILSGSLQMRVRVDTRGAASSKLAAAPGVAPPIALARQGYVIGAAMGPIGTYTSVSDDLQTVLHAWPSKDGSYPAPATDRADVWLTGPGGRPDEAQEYDGHGRAVGPPVTIPSGLGVLGQVGTTLVLVGPSPDQDLVLWDPRAQRVLSTPAPWDQEAASGSTLAWTTGAVLRVATATGSVVHTIEGPPGDWATALAFSPTGSRITVVWAPHPGSAMATTRASADEHSELDVVDTSSGAVHPVPGGQGATGPVAWAPSGDRIFFGQALGRGSSTAVASYALGGRRSTMLRMPGVNLPEDFDPATSALVAWNTR